MTNRLEGKVAIVTGGGSAGGTGIGNGRAAAILFARNGARVLVVDREKKSAADTLDLIRAEGATGDLYAGDVTNPDDCSAMVAQAVTKWGRVDVLHNNVGVSARTRGTVVELPPEEFNRVLAVNVQSMMLSCRFAIPAMVKSGGGSIINIGSQAALYPSQGTVPYAASKGAVISLTKALAVDHGKDGIRVNCIIPGMVVTPMGLANKKGEPETEEAKTKRQEAEIERRRQVSLLGINGTAWDIGYAALFFASDEARYITGTTLLVDGGAALK